MSVFSREKNSSIISNVLKARQHGTDKHISSCSLGTAFQDLRTVFAQPGWDLSPGLSAEAWVLAPSCFAHQQASISSWGVIEGARTLCSGLCVLPAASCPAGKQLQPGSHRGGQNPLLRSLCPACCKLPVHSLLSLWYFLSVLAYLLASEGASRVKEPFLFHSSLPEVQVPSQFH